MAACKCFHYIEQMLRLDVNLLEHVCVKKVEGKFVYSGFEVAETPTIARTAWSEAGTVVEVYFFLGRRYHGSPDGDEADSSWRGIGGATSAELFQKTSSPRRGTTSTTSSRLISGDPR